MRDGAPTKAKIARTALGLFVKQGVTETTIKDIARAAGVAEGALYRHYPSKEALAWDLFSTSFAAFARELDDLQRQRATTRAKLEAMIRQFCAFFDRDRTLFTYLLLAQHGQLARVTPEMPNPTEVLRSVIARGMARKEISKGDPDVATAMVMGLVLQVAVGRLYGRVTRDLSSLADSLVAAAWRVLKG
ncbi:MAG: TetR/AcrR family transcriptional regulator [Candidatus Rokubacteria bacterium]|nr:TetR/AcrR family transcriptional regulator [Candidatus Rokubacteria bacterium]